MDSMAEKSLFRRHYRGSIALAVITIALLSTRPAHAQGVAGSAPQAGGFYNSLIIGSQYDILNQAIAERHVQFLEAKVQRDAERGRTAARDRHVRRIEELKARIAIDEWLIRKNSFQQLGPYPSRIDTISLEAIAQAARPPAP